MEQSNPFVQLVSGVVWLLRNGEVYIQQSLTAECDKTQETGMETQSCDRTTDDLSHHSVLCPERTFPDFCGCGFGPDGGGTRRRGQTDPVSHRWTDQRTRVRHVHMFIDEIHPPMEWTEDKYVQRK